jgi:hypothetical protein
MRSNLPISNTSATPQPYRAKSALRRVRHPFFKGPLIPHAVDQRR